MLATYEDAAARVQYVAHALAGQDAAGWHVADLGGAGPLWTVDARSRAGQPTPTLDALTAYAGDARVRLLVIDSAASAYAGADKTARTCARSCRRWRVTCRRPSCWWSRWQAASAASPNTR